MFRIYTNKYKQSLHVIVKVNQRSVTFYSCFCSRDESERTPLHFAASRGSLACCQVMINKYEDCVNDVDKSKVCETKKCFIFAENFSVFKPCLRNARKTDKEASTITSVAASLQGLCWVCYYYCAIQLTF